MKNNVLKSVQIDTGKRLRSRFNLSYDVNSTSEWGCAQPLVCRFMYPDSKNVLGVESLIRLAPMLAPTFGRVVGKQYHQFVDVEDIYPPFTAMLNGSAFSGGNGNFVPQSVPRIPLCLLSLFVLTGARYSFYLSASDADDANTIVSFYTSGDTYTAFKTALTSKLSLDYSVSFGHESSQYHTPYDFVGACIDVSKLLDLNTRHWFQELSSKSYMSKLFLPMEGFSFDYSSSAVDPVSLEGADYVIPFNITLSSGVTTLSRIAYAAVRLSNYGKRIRKIFLGAGYQIDFQSRELVSVLPLMAIYKAYYDLFGLTAYSNYQDTNLSKLSAALSSSGNNFIELIKVFMSSTSESSYDDRRNLFMDFVQDLGSLWFTDEVDYISAHQPDTTLAGRPSGINDSPKYQNVGSSPSVELRSNTGVSRDYKDASIVSNPFSALDVKLLMKLYRWSNVQTVAGKQIADALRAAGYSGFVDSCKSNFIGSSEQMITINDVVSSADTYKRDGSSREGAVLGEYGGRGLGYDDSKPLSYETDKFGYWIGLFFIVPKSGYNQGLDQTLIDTERFDFYNPQFDALGYQMDSNSVVVGGYDFGEFPYPADPVSFGLVPRYSEWKVQKNISNGDFSLRSTRNTYLPYCLDKELPVGERRIYKIDDNQWQLFKCFGRTSVPSAGDIWRYLGRFPWIGLFDRMFVNFNEEDIYKRLASTYEEYGDNFAITERGEDNFLCHFIINLQSYAPMLPIEKSWQTDDDGSFDDSVKKA